MEYVEFWQIQREIPDTSTVEEIRPLSDVLWLNSAKASLRQTLSGSAKEPRQKLDGCPACQQEARRQLIKTMSGRSPEAPTPIEESTIEYRTALGSKIASEVSSASIIKLNQARRELAGTMAGLTIAAAKDDLIRTMQSSGIRNVTEDSRRQMMLMLQLANPRYHPSIHLHWWRCIDECSTNT